VWYCLKMVYKHGYESEHALTSEEKIRIPTDPEELACGARLRRSKLVASNSDSDECQPGRRMSTLNTTTCLNDLIKV
jgi:hypothetical protein